MEQITKIEIEGLKTIHKLCKFGADHNMEGCSFTEIVERMFEELQQAQKEVVPESINYKQLYKLAIINSQKEESKPNWAHVVSLGVGSGRAKEILRNFNIDPEATEMRNMIEAQEQSE